MSQYTRDDLKNISCDGVTHTFMLNMKIMTDSRIPEKHFFYDGEVDVFRTKKFVFKFSVGDTHLKLIEGHLHDNEMMFGTDHPTHPYIKVIFM